jgi:hypothetical protein
MGDTAGDRCSVEQHGGGDMALSSARQWTRIIVDERGGAKVRCRESRQDRHLGEFEESKSQVRASCHVESASSL